MTTRHICIFVVLLCVLTACKDGQQQTAMPGGRQVEVEVSTITASPMELFSEMSGRTTAYRIAEVRPQVNGIIQHRFFTEGSAVKAGELLYQIDPDTYQANFDSAKAALARAEAQEYSARLTAERYKKLVKTNAVSEIDQIDKEAVWKQAVADVKAASAALNSASINLNYTKITAPIDGVIGKSFITEGALVTAQQGTALAIIQQLDPLYVDVTQSSSEMLRLKKAFGVTSSDTLARNEPEVTIILEDGSEYGHKGKLKFSDVTVEQSTGTVTLRAVVANPDRTLLPGMFVRAKLSEGMKNVLTTPTASISRTQRGAPYVMLVNADSKVEIRLITTGKTVGDKTTVLSGLSAGEKVITAGLQKVRPDMQVKTVEAASGQTTPAPDAAKGE